MKRFLTLYLSGMAALVCACNTAERAKGTKSGFIATKDARIYYESTGKGDPLLLLHAGFQNVDMWDEQVSELSKHYRVIAVDLPGHGQTKNDTIRLVAANFIKTVMDSLGIQKASLMGVSLGASSVTDFLIAYPQRVNKAILVAPGLSGWETRFTVDTSMKVYVDQFFGALEAKDTSAAAEVFTRFWCDGPLRQQAEVKPGVRTYIYNTTLENMKKNKVRGWPVFKEPLAIDHLDHINSPLLIIEGDKDVPYIGQASRFIQQQVKGAKLTTIPNTGHMLNMEDPAAFNKAVLDFLQQPGTR
jgi:3-oxoadipate enol-lactonase